MVIITRFPENMGEYYTVVAYLDLIEFLFYLHKTKTMDTKLWTRWKALAETPVGMPNLEKFGTRQNMFIILILSNLWIHCDLISLQFLCRSEIISYQSKVIAAIIFFPIYGRHLLIV